MFVTIFRYPVLVREAQQTAQRAVRRLALFDEVSSKFLRFSAGRLCATLAVWGALAIVPRGLHVVRALRDRKKRGRYLWTEIEFAKVRAIEEMPDRLVRQMDAASSKHQVKLLQSLVDVQSFVVQSDFIGVLGASRGPLGTESSTMG